LRDFIDDEELVDWLGGNLAYTFVPPTEE